MVRVQKRPLSGRPQVKPIADGSGLVSVSIEGESTFFHHPDGSDDGWEGVGDDGGDPLVAVKEFDERPRGFGCEAEALVRRQDRVADLALCVVCPFCKGAESTDESAGAVGVRKGNVPNPADL